MKKCILPLALLVFSTIPTFAQKAFQSLSVGIEAGTSGVGIELALPVVTDYLVFKAGFNAPSLTMSFHESVDMEYINSEIDDVNSNLMAIGDPTRFSHFNDADMELRPTVNFSALKFMFEIYPFKKKSFHITAGAFYSMGDLLSASASVDESFWANYKDIRSKVDALNEKYKDTPGYVEATVGDIAFSAGEHTYAVKEKDGKGVMEATLAIPKFRPYVGIGFGRSMPEGHFAVQFDLGAVYNSSVAIDSPNEVDYDPSAYVAVEDVPLKYLSFLPTVSLRLIYKIF